MKNQAFNPYLPSYEYVPDGEPRVFGDRLYIFGSHDAFGGDRFCTNDYVCWSTPVHDLAGWVCHGIMYRKDQDPLNVDNRAMYAPDVVQGADGRYYLYYTLDFIGVLSVAVAAAPQGPYQFYGHVRCADGHVWGAQNGDVFQYDPGLLVDEDGCVHLYIGVAPGEGPLAWLKAQNRIMDGAYHVQLAADMLTLQSTPKRVAPGPDAARGTAYEGHSFFEASSMRCIMDTYYFIYSSSAGHELCYATASQPDGDFAYGGTLISIGDIGLDGRSEAQAVNYLGNTHGSLICIEGNWYVFYHRHTNGSQLSRQGCAERVTILPDGRIPQVELTSCGLNNGWLQGSGCYSAGIACNLSSAQGTFRYTSTPDSTALHPYITQTGADDDATSHQYIANLRDGAWAAFKYFNMQGAAQLTIRYRCTHPGTLLVHTGGAPIAALPLFSTAAFADTATALPPLFGKTALYFTYQGEGILDIESLVLT